MIGNISNTEKLIRGKLIRKPSQTSGLEYIYGYIHTFLLTRSHFDSSFMGGCKSRQPRWEQVRDEEARLEARFRLRLTEAWLSRTAAETRRLKLQKDCLQLWLRDLYLRAFKRSLARGTLRMKISISRVSKDSKALRFVAANER